MWSSVLLFALLGCGGDTTPAAGAAAGAPAAGAPAATPPTPVRVAEITASTAEDVLDATGVVEVIDTVVVHPEANGVVTEVLFSDGARVTRGQALARLRDTDARATLAEAEARLNLAELALGRIRTLREKDQAAQAELDQAQAERDLARAQVDKAREAVRRTTITAPFGGVAGKREIAPGQVVTTTTAVTRIEDLDPVTIDLALPEEALAVVREGQPARVRVAAVPGREFDGTVAWLSSRGSNARNFATRVRVPNPDGALRPGMTAAVSITTGEVSDAVVVPTFAVVQGGKGASAWVVDAEGKAEPRALTLGQRGPDTIRVLSGLASGDRLILEGYARLRPGAPVEIQPPREGAADAVKAP
jgi:membrane fusion protein (multidrug efflux system)